MAARDDDDDVLHILALPEAVHRLLLANLCSLKETTYPKLKGLLGASKGTRQLVLDGTPCVCYKAVDGRHCGKWLQKMASREATHGPLELQIKYQADDDAATFAMEELMLDALTTGGWPAINKLKYEGTYDDDTGNWIGLLGSVCPNLASLYLEKTGLSSHHLWSTMCLCKQLSTLTLDRVFVDFCAAQHAARLASFAPALRTLRLRSCQAASSIVGALSAQLTELQLESRVEDPEDEEDLPALQTAVASCTKLTSIKLVMRGEGWLPHLLLLPSLQHVTLVYDPVNTVPDAGVQAAGQWLTLALDPALVGWGCGVQGSLLKQLPLRSLQHLSMSGPFIFQLEPGLGAAANAEQQARAFAAAMQEPQRITWYEEEPEPKLVLMASGADIYAAGPATSYTPALGAALAQLQCAPAFQGSLTLGLHSSVPALGAAELQALAKSPMAGALQELVIHRVDCDGSPIGAGSHPPVVDSSFWPALDAAAGSSLPQLQALECHAVGMPSLPVEHVAALSILAATAQHLLAITLVDASADVKSGIAKVQAALRAAGVQSKVQFKCFG